jgi:hypothetical protein
VHLARRMAGREVERGEIVVVGLDVGTFGDRKAHIGEDRGDLVDHLADRVDAAALGRRLAHGQRHVDLFGGQPRLDGGIAQLRLAGGDRIGDAGLQPVDGRACRLALFRAHRTERLQPFRDRALLAERRHAHRLDRGLVAGRLDLGHQRGLECLQIAHLFGHLSRVLSANKEKPAPALPARVSQYQFSNAWEALVRPDSALKSVRGAVLQIGERLLGLGDQRSECLRLVDRHVGQHLAVDLDAGLVQAVDQAAIGQAVLAGGGVDALDPERAEIALADLAVAIGVLQRLLDRLLGDADGVLAAAVETLGGFRTFLCLAWEVTPLLTRAMS